MGLKASQIWRKTYILIINELTCATHRIITEQREAIDHRKSVNHAYNGICSLGLYRGYSNDIYACVFWSWRGSDYYFEWGGSIVSL